MHCGRLTDEEAEKTQHAVTTAAGDAGKFAEVSLVAWYNTFVPFVQDDQIGQRGNRTLRGNAGTLVEHVG